MITDSRVVANLKVFVGALEAKPPASKAHEYERIRRLLRAVDVSPPFYDLHLVASFLSGWHRALRDNNFDFGDVPSPNLTQFFGCSTHEDFSEEARVKLK